MESTSGRVRGRGIVGRVEGVGTEGKVALLGKGAKGIGNEVMVEVGMCCHVLASEVLAVEEWSDVWPPHPLPQ